MAYAGRKALKRAFDSPRLSATTVPMHTCASAGWSVVDTYSFAAAAGRTQGGRHSWRAQTGVEDRYLKVTRRHAWSVLLEVHA